MRGSRGTLLGTHPRLAPSCPMVHQRRADQPASPVFVRRRETRPRRNHTSGICPEATGAPNDGSWEYILGHTGDERTAKLAFDPGTACGYSTHALAHAALVCETVTGMPYDEFAIKALFKPLGIGHWW